MEKEGKGEIRGSKQGSERISKSWQKEKEKEIIVHRLIILKKETNDACKIYKNLPQAEVSKPTL